MEYPSELTVQSIYNYYISSSKHLPTLRWRHDGRDGISNHQPHDWLFNRLFRRRSKKTSKLRATGLCAGNSPGNGEFPAQMASNAENVPISWRHHNSSSHTLQGEHQLAGIRYARMIFISLLPEAVLNFGYCRCLRLSVCASVCSVITGLSAR